MDENFIIILSATIILLGILAVWMALWMESDSKSKSEGKLRSRGVLTEEGMQIMRGVMPEAFGQKGDHEPSVNWGLPPEIDGWEVSLPVTSGRCSHCGQYGTPRTVCVHCGAPVD
jgi:hypothetical protein